MAKKKSSGFNPSSVSKNGTGKNSAGKNGARPQGPIDIITTVSDEVFEELMTLIDEKVLSFTVWDESLADALTGDETDPDEQAVADIDLYLEGGVYFELYGAVLYADPTEAPLSGFSTIQQQLSALITTGLWLKEYAFDEDDQLVLVLQHGQDSSFYVVVGGWTMDEWDELPDQL